MEELRIQAHYDEEARVWVAVHDTLGLATEADTLDVLTYKLQELIPELARLNGFTLPDPPEFTLESCRKANTIGEVKYYLYQYQPA
jgi:hypothetical protein